MDHSHSLYPSFRGKDILHKILGLIYFRRQSSRNVFGTASRSTVHLCSRWHMQLSQMAIWQQIISLPLTSVMRLWWSLQATPTDTGMCCSFNLKSGLKDGKYKWGSLACASIQILSPDRSLLTFKTPQHPLLLRWVSTMSFDLRNLYRSLFWWPLDLVLTRWIGKDWQEAEVYIH